MELSSEAKAFEESVRQGVDPRAAVVSICVGLGIPPAEAERRVRDAEPLFADLGPEEEEALALFLDLSFVFVVDRRPDAREEEIRDLLGRAVGAMGAVRSGLGHSLHRWLRTGELTRSYLALAGGNQVKATGDPSAYWSALVAAGELLPVGRDGGEQAGIEAARAHCRRMAAQHSAAP
ncbi:hypothetical protein [Streptomyces sp. NBC_01334]|uniref:hypothetical protein n=1 Tax=Streptomyces sp. NBC_01334 TaxID=2903827 RepID=UPI002E15CA6A|nr:hypothetical protein OG736_02575 [Streptomyces sp. NBC_01334]